MVLEVISLNWYNFSGYSLNFNDIFIIHLFCNLFEAWKLQSRFVAPHSSKLFIEVRNNRMVWCHLLSTEVSVSQQEVTTWNVITSFGATLWYNSLLSSKMRWNNFVSFFFFLKVMPNAMENFDYVVAFHIRVILIISSGKIRAGNFRLILVWLHGRTSDQRL